VSKHDLPSGVEQEEHNNHVIKTMPCGESEPVFFLKNTRKHKLERIDMKKIKSKVKQRVETTLEHSLEIHPMNSTCKLSSVIL
jgi:hypothetical protein